MKTYADYVRMGKKLLVSVRVHQVHIAYFATQVCTIRHGGRSGDLYTLARYAKDIGVNRKTLSGWVSIYRSVISKLDISLDDVTINDWAIATRVHDLLKNEKQAINAAMGTERSRDKGWKINTPTKKIRDLFSRYKNSRPIEAELHGWTDTIITIKNKVMTRDLTSVSTESVLLLKKNLDQASYYLTEYLLEHRGLTIKELIE